MAGNDCVEQVRNGSQASTSRHGEEVDEDGAGSFQAPSRHEHIYKRNGTVL